jgi:hypothetical protein
MAGLKIPPIDPLRCLLFKNLKEKSFLQEDAEEAEEHSRCAHPQFI